MGSPHAPDKTRVIITPTPRDSPAVNLSVDIHFLAQSVSQSLAETGGVFVGKEAQQPKQFLVEASGHGDYRRQERDDAGRRDADLEPGIPLE